MPPPVPILYSHASSLVGGANKVLLRVMEGLDRSRFRPLAVIPEHGPMEQELRQVGVPFFILDLRATHQNRLQQAQALLRLALRGLRTRPQLVHANETLYRLTALGILGAKRVCHVHHPGSSEAGLKWLFRRVPDLVVTPSLFVRDEVLRCAAQCGIRVRAEAVWNPIDTSWFRPAEDVAALRESLGLAPQERHVLIMGALAPHKGHRCFLKAARTVLEQFPETQFHIVGGEMGRDGAYTASLEQLAAELQIACRVKFWGFTDDRQARDLIAASDVFVLPTTEEGFGLVLAESQACGVPVVTSKIRPLDEVVDAERTGYLLSADDDEAFAERTIRLLSNESLRQELGEAGRDWVEERFSRDAHVARLAALYEELLESPAEQKRGVAS